MSIIKKLANLKMESGANYSLGHSLSGNAVSNLLGQGGATINPLEEYNGFAWKCIQIRAQTLSSQDLFVERYVGKKWQSDPSHPFNEVLEGGSGQFDQSELLTAHSVSMDMYGEAFWYFTKGETSKKPMGVLLLDPSAMTVFVADNRVTGYLYEKNEQRIILDLEEVHHYYEYNPATPFRGRGPMQAAGWFVRSARYVNTYVNNFLENNAIPAGVIVAKGQVDDGDWQLFKEQWTERYAGINKAGKTGFVRGSDLDFVKTGLSLGDVDFDKIKNASRDDIMVMFGISKPMMAIYDDINRASAVTAQQLHALTFTAPTLRRICRKQSKSVAEWYGDQWRVTSTNPVPEDQAEKIELFNKGMGRWFTANEARAAYGFEPIAGGDDFQPELATSEGASSRKTIGKVRILTKGNKVSLDYEMKESFRSKMEELQVQYELKVLKAVQPVLLAQKADVLDQLQPKKIVSANFNPDDEAAKLADSVLSLFIKLAEEQGALSIAFAGNSSMSFKLTPVMEKYVADSVMKAAKSFSEETQLKIVDAVTSGVNDGESITRIGKRINGIYDDLIGVKNPGYRTERLARTEVIKTSNEMTEAAYKQSGVVQKKEWFANPGRCEFCASLNGSIVSLGSSFVPKDATITGVNGGTRVNTYENVKHPPVHPACRCTLIPVIEG